MGLAGWHPSQCDPLRPSPAPTPALHLPLLHVAGLLGLKLFPGWSPTGPQLGWEGVLGSACPDLRRRDLLPRWRVYLRGMSCSWAWCVPQEPPRAGCHPCTCVPQGTSRAGSLSPRPRPQHSRGHQGLAQTVPPAPVSPGGPQELAWCPWPVPPGTPMVLARSPACSPWLREGSSCGSWGHGLFLASLHEVWARPCFLLMFCCVAGLPFVCLLTSWQAGGSSPAGPCPVTLLQTWYLNACVCSCVCRA